MITYSLYRKTHNKTGLQYLGFTTKDPYSYHGSGLHWVRHLKKHGYDYKTEVIQRSYTKSAIKAWGLFYSKLWDIVNSKQWANLKPESGTGGQLFTGNNNPMRREEVLTKFRGENSASKRVDVRKKISESHLAKGNHHHSKNPESIKKRSGDYHYTKTRNHTSKDNPFYDHTIYCWTNIKTNEVVYLTQHEFQGRYGARPSSTSSAISGAIKSTVGWTVSRQP